MGLSGGQSPQSAMRMAAVIGSQPRFVRDPVLQNHVDSAPDQSHGRKRSVPSGCRPRKPWVPPPSMCARPITPCTGYTCSSKPSCRTTNSYVPARILGTTVPSAKRIARPSKGAMTTSGPGSPPARPWVDDAHWPYSAA